MTNKINNFIVLSSLLSFSLLHSADAASALAGGLRPLSGVIGSLPGEYRFETYNQGELEKLATEIASKRGDADREYFLKAVYKIRTQFEEHIRYTILSPNGLKQLSNKSYMTDPQKKTEWISGDVFMLAIDNYNVSTTSLMSTIASLRAYGEQAMPARTEVLPNGTVKNIAGYGQIDLSPLCKFYEEQVAKLEATLKNLPYNIIATGGIERPIPPGSGKGLDPSIARSAVAVPREKIEQWTTEARRLRMWDPLNDKPVLNDFTRFAKTQVADLLRLYGTTQRFRFHTPAYKAEKQKLEGEIAEIFWSRSYLRARYGLQLGAIQTNYTQRFANLDVFFMNTEDLAEFREEAAWTKSDYNNARQNLRLALEVAADRSILGRTSIEKDGIIVAPLQKANYFFTWLKGKHELADSARVVIELLAADLYEEMIVAEPGSLQKMQEHYRTRYYTDEESKTKVVELSKGYDPQSWATTAEEANDDPLANLGSVNVDANQSFIASGGNNDAFAKVLLRCQLKEEVDLPLALEKERSIKLATMGIKNTRAAGATKGLN